MAVLEMNYKKWDRICNNLVGGLDVTRWLHTGPANQNSCHKHCPDVTNTYPHGDRYKLHPLLWQCNQRVKWNFVDLVYLATGEGCHDDCLDNGITKMKMTYALSCLSECPQINPPPWPNLHPAPMPAPNPAEQFIMRNEGLSQTN